MPRKPSTGRTNEAIWIESRQRWQINVQRKGKRRTFADSTPGKKGKVAAERAADRWISDMTANETVKLKKLWEDFLEEIKTNTSPDNYRQHEQIGRLYILPEKGYKRVCDITIQDWQDCISYVYKQGLSKKTCKNTRGVITAFCNYARKNRIPVDAPIKGDIVIPKDAPAKKKVILQPDGIKKLFSVDTVMRYGVEEPCFFIHAWRFILLTGLRRSELCGLKKTDIEGNIIHVGGTKTDAADRYFVLSKYALDTLAAQRGMLKKQAMISNYLFPDETGGKLDPGHLYKKWDFYRSQHGINSTLHELRHTLISICKADMPEELLKQIVGHTANTDTFGIYGHQVDGEMEKAAAIFDNIFGNLLK